MLIGIDSPPFSRFVLYFVVCVGGDEGKYRYYSCTPSSRCCFEQASISRLDWAHQTCCPSSAATHSLTVERNPTQPRPQVTLRHARQLIADLIPPSCFFAPTPPSPPFQHLERTVQDAAEQKQALQQVGTSGPTPEDSVDDTETSLLDASESGGGGVGGGYNRRAAVMRASLVRCASVLIKKDHFRRATLEVSDPAAQKDARDAALKYTAPLKRPSDLGPDPLAAILHSRRSSEGTSSAGATQRTMDAWESIPPQVEEEPIPWGRGEQMVTAATSVQKRLQ